MNLIGDQNVEIAFEVFLDVLSRGIPLTCAIRPPECVTTFRAEVTLGFAELIPIDSRKTFVAVRDGVSLMPLFLFVVRNVLGPEYPGSLDRKSVV